MTLEEINNMKYIVCCPLCDNDKCVRGTDKCEAEIWAEQKMKHSHRQKVRMIQNDNEIHQSMDI